MQTVLFIYRKYYTYLTKNVFYQNLSVSNCLSHAMSLWEVKGGQFRHQERRENKISAAMNEMTNKTHDNYRAAAAGLSLANYKE